MGFFARLRNFFRGRGYIEDEDYINKEIEKIEPKKKEIQVKEEEEKEEKEIIPSEQEKKEIAKIPEEGLTEKGIEIKKGLTTEYTDTNKILKVEKSGKLNLPRPQLGAEGKKKLIDKARERITPNQQVEDRGGDSIDDLRVMKAAVIASLINADMDGKTKELVADIIIANKKDFKQNFTTIMKMDMYNTKTRVTTEDVETTMSGSFLPDVKGYLTERGLYNTANSPIAGYELGEILVKELNEQGIMIEGSTPSINKVIESDRYVLSNINYKVVFS